MLKTIAASGNEAAKLYLDQNVEGYVLGTWKYGSIDKYLDLVAANTAHKPLMTEFCHSLYNPEQFAAPNCWQLRDSDNHLIEYNDKHGKIYSIICVASQHDIVVALYERMSDCATKERTKTGLLFY